MQTKQMATKLRPLLASPGKRQAIMREIDLRCEEIRRTPARSTDYYGGTIYTMAPLGAKDTSIPIKPNSDGYIFGQMGWE
ncbi:hypothetical protein NO1_1619 [Candidatus Termititenax aidoneus]|uniref:Uncharacterized protein n=1 Tax=Termititenax aidoneus TaxID=2218524 RepID=A0A388TCA4_TERA1|nr:hypothetical protein NO1_1619 [Candidatus Termititenax aidoneus]